jgi:hypothetical protein
MPPIKIGSLVTCMDDSGFPSGVTTPVKGHTYTVRELLTSGGKSCLRLREITNPPQKHLQGTVECSFKVSRFKLKTGNR